MNVITTNSGLEMDLDDIKPRFIKVLDIARGLANHQVEKSYETYFSQAQRNCRVSRIVPPYLSLYALFYDASVAYVPQRNVNLNFAINQAFGLPLQLSMDDHDVLEASLDRVHCAAEQIIGIGDTKVFKSPDEAYSLFMKRYLELID